MRWDLDTVADALYLTFLETTPVRQVEASDTLILDLDDDDHVVGAEVLSIYHQPLLPSQLLERLPKDQALFAAHVLRHVSGVGPSRTAAPVLI